DPLSQIPDEAVAPTLNDMRVSINASELTLYSHNGRIIASSSSEASNLIPMRLDETTSLRLREEQEDVGLVPVSENSLQVRTVIKVPGPDPVSPHRILQALFPLSERINTLADNVQKAFSQYREIAYLRVPLKYSFILTLSLVLLLSILTAIWAAFYFAGRMVQPIVNLVEGTRAVAAGDYDKRLPLPGRDELGYLVRSFNEMTHKIAIAQEEARTSQQQMELQHTYLETVLANLSSGVLTLDKDHQLHTSNMAASSILNTDLHAYEGQSLDQLVKEHQPLHAFVDAIFPHLEGEQNSWHEEITLFGPGGRQILMCRGTRIPDSLEIQGGSIIVFDDITALMQAQRNAAWGEVARRLAHEIKNPLTPIQLSAERLRHKYLDKMQLEDADVLDRSTHTIVQQVETLKEMVKAFSDYARMPLMQLQVIDLNDIVNEMIELYRNSGFSIKLDLDPSAPQIEADSGRLRQLLHNLIKNAMEAMEGAEHQQLTISTRCAEEHSCRFVEMKVEDTGAGIPEDILGQLFDPYITTKPKGSGLGLAIVKKIVEEHGGMLWAENTQTGGACIIIRLPVMTSSKKQNKMDDSHNTTLMQNNDNAA
ncbi:MAG: ATP-binding protein, partial [Thioalkalispiraceae bacterium]